MKKRILVIFGTRPEAVKLAPLIMEFRKNPVLYEVRVCNTEQQKELSNQALSFFNLIPDFQLDVMRPDQKLAELQGRILEGLQPIFDAEAYDAVIVQGDTMSAFCGALAGFYNKVPVFHVEAGLRSGDLSEPFPEEAMRTMTARLADLHFSPTESNRLALIGEAIDPSTVHVTGNTGIDALFCLPTDTVYAASEQLQCMGVPMGEPLVLVTVHRRENRGGRLERILKAIRKLAGDFPGIRFVLPVHPNPGFSGPIRSCLKGIRNVVLTPPLDYPQIVCLMKISCLVMTDSGGLQEEAPTLGLPVLVLRYRTEREETIASGQGILVGAETGKIVNDASRILDGSDTLDGALPNPYGDGHASERIVSIISTWFAPGKTILPVDGT